MELELTQVGAVTSVGRGVVQACASIRAGITRPCELEQTQVEPDTAELIPLVGHPIQGLTDGFFQLGRWRTLANATFLDLLSQGVPPVEDRQFWNNSAIVCVLPRIVDERFLIEGGDPDLLSEEFLSPWLREIGLAIPESARHVIALDHAGAPAALKLARELLEADSRERVLVLAVDSYTDTLSIEWLAGQNRLKTSENPAGLSVGEASACIVLETAKSRRARSARTLALVEGIAVGQETDHSFPETLSSGKALAQSISEAVSASTAEAPLWGDVVCDLNGENWRAHEQACARLAARHFVSPEAPTSLPAVSLGDVGAASGLVSICLVAHAFARKSSSGKHALVTCSSPDGDVGAICIRDVN